MKLRAKGTRQKSQIKMEERRLSSSGKRQVRTEGGKRRASSGLRRLSARGAPPPKSRKGRRPLRPVGLTERQLPESPFARRGPARRSRRGGGAGLARAGALARRASARGGAPILRARRRPCERTLRARSRQASLRVLPRELGERNWRRSTPGGSALQQYSTISSRSRRPGRPAAAATGRGSQQSAVNRGPHHEFFAC